MRRLLAILILALPMAANADLIEITGTGAYDGTWDISLVEGTYTDLIASLAQQEWWGDQLLAETFAGALGDSMGLVNYVWLGPVFAIGPYEIMGPDFFIGSSLYNYPGSSNQIITTFVHGLGDTLVFATASRVSVPEPGTLALLGIGLAGMGLTRRRKKA